MAQHRQWAAQSGPLHNSIQWGYPILPSIQIPRGALPARFRRTRVLIIGCGDVGQRIAQALQPVAAQKRQHGPKVLALTSSPEKAAALRQLGITPLVGNLDDLPGGHDRPPARGSGGHGLPPGRGHARMAVTACRRTATGWGQPGDSRPVILPL